MNSLTGTWLEVASRYHARGCDGNIWHSGRHPTTRTAPRWRQCCCPAPINGPQPGGLPMPGTARWRGFADVAPIRLGVDLYCAQVQ